MLQKDDVISIHFTCSVDENIIDSTYDREPFSLTIGGDDLIDGVEEQLLDLKIGEKRKIIVNKEKAYGDIQSELFQIVELDRMPTDATLGNIIEGETEDGTKFQCFLKDIDVPNNIAILDFNHPLAGKDLIFEIFRIS